MINVVSPLFWVSGFDPNRLSRRGCTQWGTSVNAFAKIQTHPKLLGYLKQMAGPPGVEPGTDGL